MDYKKQIEKQASKLSEEEQDELKSLTPKINKKNKDLQKENLKRMPKTMASTYGSEAVIAGGLGAIGYAHNKGMLDGRRKLYHNTDKENVKSILEEGLKSSKTNENSFTRRVMARNGIDDFTPFKNKTYLAKTKIGANMAAGGRYNSDHGGAYEDKITQIINATKHRLKNTKTLKASIPFKEYDKIKQVDNPELKGARSFDEFASKFKDFKPKRSQYYNLGKGTATVDGDFAAKHFKGGKGYEKLTVKEILNHIKKNPKMFSKGLGLTGLGAAGVAGGGYLYGKTMSDNHKYNKKLQQDMKNDSERNRFNELFRKSIGF